MYAAALNKVNLITRLVPISLRHAREFMILPDHLHRWCVTIVYGLIAVFVACFVSYAYAEKHHLVNSFFYGSLQFSFVDGGYPELFGYALELTACAIFAAFAWAHEKKQWYAWSAILFVTFLDDAFKLHETIGNFFSVGFGVPSVGGDLIGFACTGFLSAILWFIGVRKVLSENDLSVYCVFTAYYTILIFFGVGVDAVHSLIGERMSQTVFTLFEDGGELITTATISLSALGMWLRQKHTALLKLHKHGAFQREAHSASQKTF